MSTVQPSATRPVAFSNEADILRYLNFLIFNFKRSQKRNLLQKSFCKESSPDKEVSPYKDSKIEWMGRFAREGTIRSVHRSSIFRNKFEEFDFQRSPYALFEQSAETILRFNSLHPGPKDSSTKDSLGSLF